MTRRPVKWPLKVMPHLDDIYIGHDPNGIYIQWKGFPEFGLIRPKWKPGDHLWVRETWAMIYTGEGCLHIEDKMKCPCEGCSIEYKADSGNPYPGEWDSDEAKGNDDAPKWHPSTHMPRWASRINLEITNIRIERLKEITEEDALKEGVCPDCVKEKYVTAKQLFTSLWLGIYGIDSWNQNPWVWVIEFKRIIK